MSYFRMKDFINHSTRPIIKPDKALFGGIKFGSIFTKDYIEYNL